jgi:hypothetical protein
MIIIMMVCSIKEGMWGRESVGGRKGKGEDAGGKEDQSVLYIYICIYMKNMYIYEEYIYIYICEDSIMKPTQILFEKWEEGGW